MKPYKHTLGIFKQGHKETYIYFRYLWMAKLVQFFSEFKGGKCILLSITK